MSYHQSLQKHTQTLNPKQPRKRNNKKKRVSVIIHFSILYCDLMYFSCWCMSSFSFWDTGMRMFWRLSQAVFGIQLLNSNFTGFSSFPVRIFSLFNATSLRFYFLVYFTLIVPYLQNNAMTAVISSLSRHFRRAPVNFFCERFIFNGYFVMLLIASDTALTELRYINFLQFK